MDADINVLFWAVSEGDEATVARLMDANPTILQMPLDAAAAFGNVGVVRLVVERGADIHTTGDAGMTALHRAAMGGHEKVVAFLLAKGAQATTRNDSGQTPLFSAAGSGRLGMVRLLLQHMEGQGLEDQDEDGATALHSAAVGNAGEVVRFLLLAGANPTARDNSGRTPRTLAEECGSSRCVAMFEVSQGRLR